MTAAYPRRSADASASAQSSADAAAALVGTLATERPAFQVQTSEAAAALVGVKLADLDGGRVTAMTASWIA